MSNTSEPNDAPDTTNVVDTVRVLHRDVCDVKSVVSAIEVRCDHDRLPMIWRRHLSEEPPEQPEGPSMAINIAATNAPPNRVSR